VISSATYRHSDTWQIGIPSDGHFSN
jgi:hypothetical protein